MLLVTENPGDPVTQGSQPVVEILRTTDNRGGRQRRRGDFLHRDVCLLGGLRSRGGVRYHSPLHFRPQFLERAGHCGSAKQQRLEGSDRVVFVDRDRSRAESHRDLLPVLVKQPGPAWMRLECGLGFPQILQIPLVLLLATVRGSLSYAAEHRSKGRQPLEEGLRGQALLEGRLLVVRK